MTPCSDEMVGTLVAKGLSQKPMQPNDRLEGLRLMKTPAEALLKAAPSKAAQWRPTLSLLASAELIGRARLLVTNDSSPLHLASAMNTPTLAIFGPTVPEFGFGPLADLSVVAGVRDLDCRPCDRHGPMRCPLTHWKCMRDQTAEELARRALELLGQGGST